MENIISIPFLIGIGYLFVVLTFRCIKWIVGLSKFDKIRLFKSIRSRRLFQSIKETFMEALLHRKIFRKNPVLGYMHMSLAFGWFLLIVVGHLETMIAEHSLFVPFHKAVFFRYYEGFDEFFLSGLFSFLMDFLLLFVLSGLMFAIVKRFRKKLFGLRRTTHLKSGDKIALTSLWLIFPLRLLAESTSAAVYHNGGFLTSGVGAAIDFIGNPAIFYYPLWMAYSLSLGFFFVALPNSRYMHIPTEVVFIFLRVAGIRLKKQNDSYTDVQVFSCSRCGICLDKCQLSVAGIDDSQSVYLLKNIRNKNLSDEKLFNCLMCGRCQVDCPVGIETIELRTVQRIESTREYNSSYDYLIQEVATKADVVYFAGCMTHLTPRVISSMKKIFATAEEDVWFMDEVKAPCCGRPLMLAGQYEAARKLIENNSRMILDSGAHTLVVSCPICYKVFKEDYKLPDVEVVFHAQYIYDLIHSGKLSVDTSNQRMVYHDPCELGRGMGMYETPRKLLGRIGEVVHMKDEKEYAFCCGGSLGNLKISEDKRKLLRDQALVTYEGFSPNILVTACPKCKKTFAAGRKLKVFDLAEVVAGAICVDSLSKEKEILEKQEADCYAVEGL
ncbi:(Fe-S)-binding protein [Marinilabilia salmonicolor]|nr:(Fe-S)-binding protein [Marinilabilia salmonicolor]